MEPHWTIESRSVADTESAAARLARERFSDRGGVIALDGDLGAGKTQFVRGLVKALGGEGRQVHSPTFVLMHQHPLPGGRTLHHLDLYRLGGEEELESIGFDELLQRCDDAGDIIAVEWPSRAGGLLPAARTRVELLHLDPSRRRIRVESTAA